MPRVHVQAPPEGSSWGASIALDGRAISDVTSIDLSIRVDEIATVKLGVIATERLSFDGDAAVHVTVIAMPGYEIVESFDDNGTRRFRCVEVQQ